MREEQGLWEQRGGLPILGWVWLSEKANYRSWLPIRVLGGECEPGKKRGEGKLGENIPAEKNMYSKIQNWEMTRLFEKIKIV